MSLPKILKKGSLCSLRSSPEPSVTDIPPVPSTSMPLEIIFKLIDDYWRVLVRENGDFGLRSLSQTCRPLWYCCRPFLLHSVTVYGRHQPPMSVDQVDMVTRPTAFAKLVRAYPEMSSHVKKLQIVLFQAPLSKEGLALRKIGLDAPEDDVVTWQNLLTATYLNLTTLHFIASWETLPPKITAALFAAIEILPNLDRLEIEGEGIPVCDVPPICPPSLKHLSIYAFHYNFERSQPQHTLRSQPPCHLETLTVNVGVSRSWFAQLLPSHQISPISVQGLQHLQATPRYLNQNLMKVLRASSSSLRCAHFSFNPLAARAPGDDVGILNLQELPALTHLEVVPLNSQDALTTQLTWLEGTLQTLAKFPSRLANVTVCILISSLMDENFSDIYGNHLWTWRTVVDKGHWHHLGLAKSFGFSLQTRPVLLDFPRRLSKVPVPRPLSRFGSRENDVPYQALWKECSCTGWKVSMVA